MKYRTVFRIDRLGNGIYQTFNDGKPEGNEKRFRAAELALLIRSAVILHHSVSFMAI